MTVTKFDIERAECEKLLDAKDAEIERLKAEKFYWNCPTHGESQTAWGCPECMREARQRIAELEAENCQLKLDKDELHDQRFSEARRVDILRAENAKFERNYKSYIDCYDRIVKLEAENAKLKDELSHCELDRQNWREECLQLRKLAETYVPKEEFK